MKLCNNEIDGMLLADGEYPCARLFLTPISNSTTIQEGRDNKVKIKLRNLMERIFGVWKRRFPCLQIDLATKFSTNVNIVVACALLHNIAMEEVNDMFEVDEDLMDITFNNNALPSSYISTIGTSDDMVF